MLTPHVPKPALAGKAAMMTLTHEQLTALCNALWNLYATVEPEPEEARTPLTVHQDVQKQTLIDKEVLQRTYEGFVNCMMALERTVETEKQGGWRIMVTKKHMFRISEDQSLRLRDRLVQDGLQLQNLAHAFIDMYVDCHACVRVIVERARMQRRDTVEKAYGDRPWKDGAGFLWIMIRRLFTFRNRMETLPLADG
jgi:hypothetical protein